MEVEKCQIGLVKLAPSGQMQMVPFLPPPRGKESEHTCNLANPPVHFCIPTPPRVESAWSGNWKGKMEGRKVTFT